MTKKFQYKTSQLFQGDFVLGDLNLMLVFQVNCPGCFIYALPAANKMVELYKDKGLKVLGLATAFEDYDLNTPENVSLLLKDGTLVGETKKMLIKAGHEHLPFKLKFDVAFDVISKSESEGIDDQIDNYIKTVPDYEQKNEVERRLMHAQIKEYLLNKKMNAFTFDTNFLMGTPSWILFDRDLNIHYDIFGHKEFEKLHRIVDEKLSLK